VTPVYPSGVLSFGSAYIVAGSSSQDVGYPYQFNISGLTGSNIYTRASINAPQAFLLFCAKLELLLNSTGQSVSFLKNQVNLTLDMTKLV